MTSMRQSVRFAVGSASGPRSTVWKLLAHDREAYLVPATPGPSVKVSFHETGQCHYSLPTHASAVRSAGSRVPALLDVWKPTSMSDTLTTPFRIIVPTDELRSAAVVESERKPVIWISPTEGASATVIFFILAQRPLDNDEMLRSDAGARLLAVLPLGQERTIIAVWAPTDDPEDAFPALGARYRQSAPTAKVVYRAGKLDRGNPDTRILVPLTAPGGDRAILDLAFHDKAA